MPINAALVGQSTDTRHHEVDARWTMAYSASLGDTSPHYLDTTRPVVAHPMFTIAPEWAVQCDGRDMFALHGLTPDENLRSVHATHDCHIHRLVRPGDRLATRATMVQTEARRPGAYVVTKLETTDADGAPVCTTWQGSVYRGVEVEGGDQTFPADPPPPTPVPAAVESGPLTEIPVHIPANLAHVYSECARIWNPIHTDEAVARSKGLPTIILHGSATLALAVSRLVEHALDGDPNQVRRFGGMFRGMVLMPSEIRMRVLAQEENDGEQVIAWDVVNADGGPVITNGFFVSFA